MNLDCCSVVGNPSLALTDDLVVLDPWAIPKSDSSLLAVGDEGVVDDNVIGRESLIEECRMVTMKMMVVEILMVHLGVKCGSIARSVAGPIVVEEQVVLDHTLVPRHLDPIISSI